MPRSLSSLSSRACTHLSRHALLLLTPHSTPLHPPRLRPPEAPAVLVVNTNEELEIAEQACEVIDRDPAAKI